MRKFIFRGKSIDTGEWSCGLGISVETNFKEEPKTIYVGYNEVDPETVEQYTGIEDRNGKKIFEGDIVKHYNHYSDPERFEIGLIYWEPKECRFVRTSNPGHVNIEKSCIYEVIGNRYDNPELMGK